ncbi:MAG TPA: twin-arginine translocase TatA/TatE family subunit [Candidatus Thermoplasmatota archaeon]
MNLPHVFLLFGSIGTPEIMFLLLLILLLFGAQKIPDLARSLGRAQREFTKAREEIVDAQATPTDDERVRKAAKDLGLTVEGRTTEEVRQAIADKMK